MSWLLFLKKQGSTRSGVKSLCKKNHRIKQYFMIRISLCLVLLISHAHHAWHAGHLHFQGDPQQRDDPKEECQEDPWVVHHGTHANKVGLV